MASFRRSLESTEKLCFAKSSNFRTRPGNWFRSGCFFPILSAIMFGTEMVLPSTLIIRMICFRRNHRSSVFGKNSVYAIHPGNQGRISRFKTWRRRSLLDGKCFGGLANFHTMECRRHSFGRWNLSSPYRLEMSDMGDHTMVREERSG